VKDDKELKTISQLPFFQNSFYIFYKSEADFYRDEIEQEDGFKTSVVILFAFLGGAAFPAVPYLLAGPLGFAAKTTFIVATCITVIGLFGAGAMKKFVTGVNWLKSGFEMLI